MDLTTWELACGVVVTFLSALGILACTSGAAFLGNKIKNDILAGFVFISVGIVAPIAILVIGYATAKFLGIT